MRILTEHQKRALNYKQHISLTANAGSGKTFVLSKRYLEIAINEKISLRNIAAITFTDKAAGELYKKIALQIEEKLKTAVNQKEIKKLEDIRRQLVSANISTIHSFCIDILREYPVEAEIDANFSPIDETLSNELIELSVEEMIKESLRSDDESQSLKYLIRIFASKSIFSQEIKSLIKNRRNVLNIAQNLYSKNEEEIADYFHCSFLNMLKDFVAENREEITKRFLSINKLVLEENPKNKKGIEVSRLIQNLINQSDPLKFIDQLKEVEALIFTKNRQSLFVDYMASDLQKEIKEEIEALKDLLKDINKISLTPDYKEVEKELAKLGKKIINFFNKALEKYESKKKENGFLDFEDILLLTQNTLTLENVRDSLSQKYKYIMIDEYQDTNELQYQIFMPILDNLKNGNLFIVGDEKQSIYMFRDSELEVFDRTKKDIADVKAKGASLTLPDSFRMAPELCLFTNKLFSNLFAKPNLIFNEVGHSELVCARDENKKGIVEILLAKCNEEDKSYDTEAELVARKIIRLINDEKLSWRDIAILCRKRKYFTTLEKFFLQYSIPFSILGGKGFYQRQSVYDVYNYFSFLLDKNNDTALIGILRSPFFTISDSEIFEISYKPGRNFWLKLINHSSSKEKLKKVVLILKENLELVKTYNVTALLRKILRETGFLAVLSSRKNSSQELANIDKLVKITIDFHSQGFKTLYDYVNFLKESIEKTEDEAQAALTDESDSVKIMTLHQAKGLEFPAVFLFKCGDYPQRDMVKSKSVTVNKHFGLLGKIPVRENYFSDYESAPINGMNNLITEKKNLAEEKRLLYVGITRAINYLFISATEPEKAFNKASFMHMLLKGLNLNMEESSFEINYPVTFLRKKDDVYYNEVVNYNLVIPVIKEIEIDHFEKKNGSSTEAEKLINIEEIKDQTKSEIISATKAAVYHQCPLKYKMTYEYGFVNLYKDFKDWGFKNLTKKEEVFEFKIGEEASGESSEEEKNYINNPQLKGKIIHEILQKEITEERLALYLQENFSASNELNNNVDLVRLKEEIQKDLIRYFKSGTYLDLTRYKNSRNEFEVYLKESDFFLYGIIDKLIIEDNKAVIVDYKTDDIPAEEVAERGENYLLQLKFYAYIISKLFKDISETELKIIFIKHPDNPVITNLTPDEINSVKLEIEKMVYNIRNKDFPKNLNHCSKCIFASIYGSCIMK